MLAMPRPDYKDAWLLAMASKDNLDWSASTLPAKPPCKALSEGKYVISVSILSNNCTSNNFPGGCDLPFQ